MSTPNTDCPVCGKTFDSAIIEQHVNQCLNDEIDFDEVNDRKRKQSDWDFLTKGQKHVSKPQPAKKARVGATPNGHQRKSPVSSRKSAENGISKKSETITTTTAQIEDSSDVEFVSEEETSLSVRTDKTESQKQVLNACSSIEEEEKHGKSKNTKNSKQSFSSLFSGKGNANTNVVEANRSTLTGKASKSKVPSNKPLAEKVRPTDLAQYVGQKSVVGKKSLLHSIFQQGDTVPSMILWGPPGCGKTTLARIIAQRCKEKSSSKFVHMSATSATVVEVKEAAKVARNDLRMLRKKTILFLDEVHRFNKLQQDALLPHVEDGTITLIGATTENPSFHVNGALLSRCRLVTLDKLQIDDIKTIIRNALPSLNVSEIKGEAEDEDNDEDDMNGQIAEAFQEYGSPSAYIETSAVNVLAGLVDGDARTALNGLQLAVEGKLAGARDGERVVVTMEDVKEGLQRSHILYDKTGEEHYNTVSALIKSMRGSDANAALYWLARMLEGGENPLFIVRRLVVFASEDVGLADPNALTQAVSTYQACHFIGMPECAVNLSQCVVYLSRAPKSVEVYMALNAARQLVKNGPLPPVPLHLRNPTNAAMKSIGYGKGYKYPPNFRTPVKQDYFPPELVGTNFFTNS